MEHPENLEEVNEIKATDVVREHIVGLAQEIEEAKGKRSDWEHRQEDYYRKRFGIRKRRTFPWKGYPNYILPLIDSDIHKAKPSYVNLAYGVSPIVTFEPFGPRDVEPARNREQLFDFRLKHKMDFFEPYCVGIDKMLQFGFVVYKIIWNYSSRTYTEFLNIGELPQEVIDTLYDEETTDVMLKKILQEHMDVDMSFEENEETLDKTVADFREGKTEFTINLTEVENNEPQMIVCDPKDDIVVPPDTCDLNDARWIDYRFFLTVNDLKTAMRDGKYNKMTDNEILEMVGRGEKTVNQDKARREGVQIDDISDEVMLLHETCLWYDIDGDGIAERCIATWADQQPSKILRFIEMPYDHGMWPYVQVEREFVDTGFYSSRGIPALDDDFQTGISASFNNDLANQLIVNTPQVVYRRNAVKNIRNLRYVPGEPIEVDDINNSYKIQQNVNASQGTFMLTQQQLKAWAQERIGNPSHNLTGPNNMPGAGVEGKKTAREVDEISAITSQGQSLDLILFQNQMKWVYYQIDSLYYQYGAEEEFIMTGERPVKVGRRDIQGRFNIMPNGKLSNSNPVLRAQQSFMMLQAFRNDPRINQDELYKTYLNDIDPKLQKRLLISPEERAQIQQMQQQITEQAKVKGVLDAAGVKKIEDNLELQKEMGIRAIHGRRYARDGESKVEKKSDSKSRNG